MKKRFLALLMSAAMVAGLVACGNTETETPASGLIGESIDGNDSTGNVTSGQADNNSKKDPVKYDEEGYQILYAGYDNPIFAVNKYGDIIDTITHDELSKLAEKNGADYDSMNYITVVDGVVYTESYLYDDNTGKSSQKVYALKPSTDEFVEVATYSPDNNDTFLSADFYKGALYVIYSNNDNVYQVKEDKFTPAEGKLSFTKEDSEYSALLKNVVSYYVPTNFVCDENYCHKACIGRTIDEYGYIPAFEEGEFYLVKANGEKQEIKALEQDVNYVFAYDQNYIFINNYDYVNGATLQKVYDIKNDKFELSLTAGETSIAYANGKLYYYRDEDENFGTNKYVIYTYDPATTAIDRVYEAASTPGYSILPGVTGFTYGDFIYFLVVQDGKEVWAKLENSEAISYYDYVCDVYTNPIFEYGKIVANNEYLTCDKCGLHSFGLYIESMELDKNILGGKYADVVEKINGWQKFSAEDTRSRMLEYAQDASAEYCDEHGTSHMLSYTKNINSIEIIADKYIAINYSSYEYTGGVHGMPGRGQFLYDLSTGGIVYFDEICKLTDEEFRNVLEKYTIAHWEENKEYYYTGTSKEDLKEAISRYGVRNYSTELHENGVIFSYSPYEVGPYASGYIEIEIPYSELL